MIRGIKITKEEFNNIEERNVVFITNPGRMGDEDGSTFIIKNNEEYIIYRVDGWMYGKAEDFIISLEEMFQKFPQWKEMWDNCSEESYTNKKYKYIYMGYGNGLSVDKDIYDEFNNYLLESVKKNDKYNPEEGNDYYPGLNYASWEDALNNYAKDKGIKLKY